MPPATDPPLGVLVRKFCAHAVGHTSNGPSGCGHPGNVPHLGQPIYSNLPGFSLNRPRQKLNPSGRDRAKRSHLVPTLPRGHASPISFPRFRVGTHLPHLVPTLPRGHASSTSRSHASAWARIFGRFASPLRFLSRATTPTGEGEREAFKTLVPTRKRGNQWSVGSVGTSGRAEAWEPAVGRNQWSVGEPEWRGNQSEPMANANAALGAAASRVSPACLRRHSSAPRGGSP